MPEPNRFPVLASPVRGDETRNTALRVSVAKDRTVKRLLRELVTLGESAKEPRVVKLR